MKHKHYDCIVAWAKGSEIQFKALGHHDWKDVDMNGEEWYEHHSYRIKPEPKPDVVESVTLWRTNGYDMRIVGEFRLVTDGETGKLKSAEVL